MEIVPYLITFAAGLACGIFFEWKYGKQGAQINADLHAKLDEIKTAVGQK